MQFAVYVLGAGFSVPAGLPTAAELWAEVRRRASAMQGRAGQFNDDLNAFIEYKKRALGQEITLDAVNFEEFLGFLDIEFFLGLRGSDTWSDEGNETQVVVKTLISRILTERTPRTIPELYLKLAEALQPEDLILTFNYDTLLERALDSIGKPFRLFRRRLESVGPHSGTVDTSKDEVIIFKLHGSVDWFDRRHYRMLQESHYKQTGQIFRFHSPIFNNERVRMVPLVEGERFASDPLREIHRILNIEEFTTSELLFHETPVMLNPSPAKVIYADRFRDFWHGLGEVGVLNFRMAVIGFSLPPADDYARQVLYRIITNYQNSYWDETQLGKRKQPLLLIDFRPTVIGQAEYRQNYRFVNWERADVSFGGFDDSTIGKL
jgi:hypothetical protein